MDLYKFFTSRGFKVKKAKVVLDQKTSKSKGYGYLAFFAQDEAERCLKEMNNTVIHGHAVILSLKVENKSFNEKANIIIKNIDKEAT